MIPRYLIVVGPTAADWAARAEAIAARVTPIDLQQHSAPGADMLVLANVAAGPQKLDSGAIWLIGTIFESVSRGAGSARFDPAEAALLAEGRGAMLIERYWGRFVALLRSEDDRVDIIRDPSGALPCYCLVHDGALVLASDVDLLIEAGLYRASVDWTALAMHLCADEVRHNATCLVDLTELPRGTRLSWSGEGLRVDTLWSPWQFAGKEAQILDREDAVERVRRTTLSCVNAWARQYEHVLLALSGGLDSSIVAACLARSQTTFTMLTLAAPGSARDERPYARLVAEQVGRPLVEQIEDMTAIDLERSHAAHLPRPLARLFAQIGNRHQLDLAHETGAGAFFGGGGGDNVFCSMRSAAPIVDRILSNGPGPAAWETLENICAITGCTWWAAARQALHRILMRRRGYRWRPDTRFLSADAAALAPDAIKHPWLEAPRSALPGKAVHIAWLVGFQNHLEGFERECHLPKLSPLLSQPLVELCLRIPSWMWCTGGRDRAMARQAFARDLPAAIVERRGKGSPDYAVASLYDSRRATIRDMLLGGVLGREGLLDLPALSAALNATGPARGSDYARIMGLLDAEMWARCWPRGTARPDAVRPPAPPSAFAAT